VPVGLGVAGAVLATVGWAGSFGVAGWIFAGRGSLGALGLRASPSVLGLRLVIVSPGSRESRMHAGTQEQSNVVNVWVSVVRNLGRRSHPPVRPCAAVVRSNRPRRWWTLCADYKIVMTLWGLARVFASAYRRKLLGSQPGNSPRCRSSYRRSAYARSSTQSFRAVRRMPGRTSGDNKRAAWNPDRSE
jgi:hypothetical protein